MATTLTMSATDSLSHQQHQQPINDKWKQKVKEVDGAGFMSSPENSPATEKYNVPESPQQQVTSTHIETVSSRPAITNAIPLPTSAPSSSTPVQIIRPTTTYTSAPSPLQTVTTIPTDPLEFIAEHIASLRVRPAYVPEYPLVRVNHFVAFPLVFQPPYILFSSLYLFASLILYISQLEKQILQAQTRKREELLEKRRRDREMNAALEQRIKERENLLAELQADMRRKVKHIESKKDSLEQFRIDFAETVKQQVPSSSTVQKSAANRMLEEREKKKLLAEWKNNNSEETLHQLRRTILVSQDEVMDLNLRIVNLKKELNLLQRMQAAAVSSHFHMREVRDRRADMAAQGIPRPCAEAKPRGPPPPPVPRSHLTRMQEEKERKAALRAARNPSASTSNYPPSSCYAMSPSNFASSSSKTTQAM